MTLQLYINERLFAEGIIPAFEFEKIEFRSFEFNFKHREKRLEAYIDVLKSTYFRPIAKCKTWYIFLVAGSKMNIEIEDQIKYAV